MNVLYVDLEREWRGGQSQALLTLRGLRERGHEVELLAARDSAVANRAAEAGVKVHQVPRFGLRGWTAVEMRKLTAQKRFELVHLNEPHALTAAWLARAHARVPLLLSRRIGFPLQRNAVSRRDTAPWNDSSPTAKMWHRAWLIQASRQREFRS